MRSMIKNALKKVYMVHCLLSLLMYFDLFPIWNIAILLRNGSDKTGKNRSV